MGSLSGHVVPGTFVLLGGLGFFIAVILQLQRDGRKISTGQDYDFLAQLINGKPQFFVFVAIITLLEVFCEIPLGLINGRHMNYSHSLSHCVLYIGEALAPIAALLERKGKLPRTSCVWCLAVANWATYHIWNVHAMMQKGGEATFHKLLADVVFMTFIASLLTGWLAVIKHEKLPVALIIISFFYCLKGITLITIGFCYFYWYTPFSYKHRDLEPWVAPMAVSYAAFGVVIGLGAIWNCVGVPKGQNSSSLSGSDPSNDDETMSTEEEPLNLPMTV